MLKVSDISDSESNLYWDAQKLASEGKIAFEKGDLSQSYAFLHKALELDSENADIHVDLANLYSDLHKTHEGREHCLAAIRLNPASPRPWQCLGNIEKSLGNIQTAITHYEKSIELDEKYYKAYNSLGNCYSQLNELELAEKFYLKALKINSEDYLAIHGLANYYAQLHEFEKSEILLESIDATQLARYYIQPFYDVFSGVKYKLKKYDQAIALAENLYDLGTNPETQYFALSRIAFIYYHTQDFQQASKYYERALEFDSSNLDSWTQLLWSLAQIPDKARMQYWIEKAEATFPEDSILWFHTAALHRYLGDITNAIFYMEIALELDPLFVEAKVTLAYFYFLDKQNDKALDLAKETSQKLMQITNVQLSVYMDHLAEYLRFTGEAELSTQFLARYKDLNT
jgi:tetratricopeptide (TPR) repeat protein